MTFTVSAEPQDGTAPPGEPSALPATTRFFEGHPIRMTALGNEPWLSASDLCRALQLRIGGKITPAKYIRGLLAADRAYAPFQTQKGEQSLSVISVSGAMTLASSRNRRVDTKLRAWLRREFPDA